MARRRDDDFRPRFSRSSKPSAADGLVARALRAAGAGSTHRVPRPLRHRGPAGRGQALALTGLRTLPVGARRVVVKAHLVTLRGRLRASTRRHLGYLQREGLEEPSAAAPLYDAEVDAADATAFADRSAGDPRQFRFILAPEDGADIGDLRAFTRSFMQQVERDLCTPLDWVAVDHRDTDHPHSHILVRGKTADGRDLLIGRDYISHGMRIRARQLATDWLGPRTALEIQAEQAREISADRWTPLDATLQRQAVDGVVDLRHVPDNAIGRAARMRQLGRLAHLEHLGLATRLQAKRWSVSPRAEDTLRRIGERGDIIRLMQRTRAVSGWGWSIYDPARSPPLNGHVVARGLAGERQEQGYIVVADSASRAHYVRLAPGVALTKLPIGSLVCVRAGGVTLRASHQLDRANDVGDALRFAKARGLER